MRPSKWAEGGPPIEVIDVDRRRGQCRPRSTPSSCAAASSQTVVTDQTSAHDPLRGYIPAPLSVEEAADLRERDPQEYLEMVKHSVREHVGAMLGFQRKGVETFDYGNNLRGLALESGVTNAFDIPGFVPAYIRPLFAEGKGPFRGLR